MNKAITTTVALSILTVIALGVTASPVFGQLAQVNEEAKVKALIERYAKSIESAPCERTKA